MNKHPSVICVCLVLAFSSFAQHTFADRIFTTSQERKEIDVKRFNSEVIASAKNVKGVKQAEPISTTKLDGVITHKGQHSAVWLNGSRADVQPNVAIDTASNARRVNVYFVDRDISAKLKPGQVHEFESGKDSDFFEYQASNAQTTKSTSKDTRKNTSDDLGEHKPSIDTNGERVAQTTP